MRDRFQCNSRIAALAIFYCVACTDRVSIKFSLLYHREFESFTPFLSFRQRSHFWYESLRPFGILRCAGCPSRRWVANLDCSFLWVYNEIAMEPDPGWLSTSLEIRPSPYSFETRPFFRIRICRPFNPALQSASLRSASAGKMRAHSRTLALSHCRIVALSHSSHSSHLSHCRTVALSHCCTFRTITLLKEKHDKT
jgi:hypothetical protein